MPCWCWEHESHFTLLCPCPLWLLGTLSSNTRNYRHLHLPKSWHCSLPSGHDTGTRWASHSCLDPRCGGHHIAHCWALTVMLGWRQVGGEDSTFPSDRRNHSLDAPQAPTVPWRAQLCPRKTAGHQLLSRDFLPDFSRKEERAPVPQLTPQLSSYGFRLPQAHGVSENTTC